MSSDGSTWSPQARFGCPAETGVEPHRPIKMEAYMRTPGILAVFAAVILAAGCDSATGPVDALAPPAPTADVVTNEPDAPFDFLVTTCEEDVYGSGRLHILAAEAISPAGDTASVLHFNGQGTGLGLSSGALYRFNDAYNVSTHQNGPLPMIVEFRDALNLIGIGGTPDLHVLTTFHVTVNANGSLSVQVDDVRQRCG